MIPGAEAAAQPSTETFGLPDTVPQLFAKLRLVPEEIRDQIIRPKERAA